MGATRELLRDDMILEATGPDRLKKGLDVMASLVYRCAVERKSVAQTVDTVGLDREMTCRIINELVSRNIVAVSSNHATASTNESGRTPSVGGSASSSKIEKPTVSDSFIEELDRLYSACQKANYYELLGIDLDSPRAEMRGIYFDLSKRFHPDKAFGEAAREHKKRMAVVFQKLTEAYETLSNPKRRGKYNESLGDQLELWAMENKLKKAMDRSRSQPPVDSPPSPPKEEVKDQAKSTPVTKKDEKRAAPTPAGSSARPTTNIKRPSSVPSERPPPRSSPGSNKGEFSASPRRPGNSASPKGDATNPPGQPRFRPSVPPSPSVESRREAIRRRRAGRAMEAIYRRGMSNGPAAPQINRVPHYLDEAGRAMEKEAYKEAIGHLKKALEQFPDNSKAQEMLQKATEQQQRAQAGAHLRRGRYARSSGEHDQAKWHFEQALSIDKGNLDGRHLLADLFVDRKQNLDRALKLMREIIVLGGQRARYFATLGEIFLLTKELDRAADAFNKAIVMEPNNKEFKKRLRLCKK